MYFDDLYYPLAEMTDWQKTAFAAAVTERIFPHFALYDELLEYNNVAVARNALDKVWDKISARGSCNPESQIAKIEAIVHSEEDTSFGAGLAFDALVAVMVTLHCLEEASVEDASGVAHLSRESIAKYLELHAEEEFNEEDLIRYISTHELMAQELNFQVEVMQKLQDMRTPKAAQLDAIKAMAQANGVSNIGISLER
ncbi:MAG: YjaG family protein [Gammaproteobacteria bacterium]|jgi:uncharacterized protein YjaG (DUF416 family)|nr:YjaG family protein [Gammaproteobacteria bacterium]MDP6164830.1 DUF416 family protein [Gammaproteobacteria bacterium]